VAEWLQARGLALLGRNVRVGHLEIDLIARDGPVVAVIEVRTRGPGARVPALASVDAGKRQRLRAAGTILWLRRFSRLPGVERMRFDVAAVDLEAPTPVVEYVRAAF
jgi:putative endonuclease